MDNYRLLREGEVTQENDEISDLNDSWIKVAMHGYKVSWGLEGCYRRSQKQKIFPKEA